MHNKHTLRDIKKEATAQALADAAFRLALERGLDGFVVDEVAHLAGYSRRTFANHFSCKEEAVAAAVIPAHDLSEAETAIMADVPAGAAPLDVLRIWLKAQFTVGLFRRMRDLVSLSRRYPTLEPYILSAFRRLQSVAEEAIGVHCKGRYPDGYSHVLMGAVYGAILPVVEGRLRILLPGDSSAEAPDAVAFEQYLDTTFGYLRHGF